MASQRFRNWGLIAYPDSLPDNWLNIIQSFHVPVLISPLHQPDQDQINPDEPGECAYKPHYHIVFTFDGVQTLDQVSAMVQPLNCTRPFRLFSRNGYIRYLIHLDNPDKPKYEKMDILVFNGAEDAFHEAFDIGEYDTTKVIEEMNKYILDTGICEFVDLYEVACDRPKWAYVLNKFQCKSIHALLASMRYGR